MIPAAICVVAFLVCISSLVAFRWWLEFRVSLATKSKTERDTAFELIEPRLKEVETKLTGLQYTASLKR